MSVPIAVVGEVPKIRISSGVISDPPPMPVIPTSTPIHSPNRTIAGSIWFLFLCRESARMLLDFLDLAGRECGVREDNGVSVVVRDLSHSYGELRSLGRVDLTVGDGEAVAMVGPSGCGKSTLLEIVCGLRDPSAGQIAVEGDAAAPARLSHCAYM